MSFYKEFDPYQWPPDIVLADLHSRCSMPGKENPDGQQCPCCHKRQKLRTTNWISRDIYKDFKNYGGGIPAYFGLIFYYAMALIIILLISGIFHAYCLNLACTQASQDGQLCISAFVILKLMTTQNIIKTLKNSKNQSEHILAKVLQNINFIIFIELLLVNFLVHYYLVYIQKKITKRKQILSKFSIFLKNIPKNQSVDQLRKKINELRPSAQIKQIFFLHRLSQYCEAYDKTLDSYFLIKYYQEYNQQKNLQNQKVKFIKSYQNLQKQQQQLKAPTGRAIIIFQKIEDKQFFQSYYYKNDFSKFWYHTTKLLNLQISDKTIYGDKMSEPGQILWKYIGDSSVFKTKVRIQTTLTTILFLVICYGMLFFPLKLANKQQTKSSGGSAWNLSVSLVLIIMTIIYRNIMVKLSQQRKPNTYKSRSLFVLMTNILFHLCFYLIIPVIFYVQQTQIISQTEKLKSLLTQIFTFLIICVILASIDLRHCCFQGDRQKYLSKSKQSHKLCQRKLHHLLSVPPFPIQFKLMVLYKIWSFVLFWAFQLPEFLVLVLLLLFFLYWNDKKNIYTHYKMQAYLPIQLQQSFQQTIIYFLMIYLCFGYLIVAQKGSWSYYLAPCITFFALIVKFFIHKLQDRKKKQQQKIQKGMSLKKMMQTTQIENKQDQLYEQLINQDDYHYSMSSYIGTTSLKSLQKFTKGYKDNYEIYLHQFKNKKIKQVIDYEYRNLVNDGKEKRRESELVHI